MSAQRALRSFRAPDERGAAERGWNVVRPAFQERKLSARRRTLRRRGLGPVVAAVLVTGLAISPAGATVEHAIDRALGVQQAAPALSSLPASGRLLVSGPGGTWTVGADGSALRVGPWSQASWSPHGLYLTVTGGGELAVVNPRGATEWTLARPEVSDPRWYSPTGYRVAYLSANSLRVVTGTGSGDHLLVSDVAPVAPSWRPGHPYQLAYVSGAGTLVVRDGDSGAILWSAHPVGRVRELVWSADGRRLLALSDRRALVYAGGGRLLANRSAPEGAPILSGQLSPDGRALALITGAGNNATISGRNGATMDSNATIISGVASRRPLTRRVLSGAGLEQLAWSPDGHWLLISWPAANQWVFVRVVGPPRIVAVSRIAQQLSVGSPPRFPRLEGWCCNAEGAPG